MTDPLAAAGTFHRPVQNRLDAIDALRAVALAGVILMNIGAMVMVLIARDVFAGATASDLVVIGLDLAFVQGKARSAFAFLFGFGFAILMARADAKGSDFRGFYTRRMLLLFGFGLFNQAFLFWGDILCLYALLGLVLLGLRGASDRSLLGAGLVLVVAPPLATGLYEALVGPFPNLLTINRAAEHARAVAALTSANYLDAVRFTWSAGALRYATETGHMLIYATGVLGLFLLGAWTQRRGILVDAVAHRPLLRRIAWAGLPLGLILSVIHSSRLAGFELEGLLGALVVPAYVGVPIMALGYIAALALLFARGARGAQAFLAPAGRMALTNYLLSGAIGGWIFYGYGLGLLRAFDIVGLNLLATALFLGLVLFSHVWLARFRFGPAEWLWRSLTYGELQPLRRAPRKPVEV